MMYHQPRRCFCLELFPTFDLPQKQRRQLRQYPCGVSGSRLRLKPWITTNQRCCFPVSPECAEHRTRRENSTGTKAPSLELALARIGALKNLRLLCYLIKSAFYNADLTQSKRRVFNLANAHLLPPPAAKMRWPAPIRARLPLCEGSPGKPQFGGATEASRGQIRPSNPFSLPDGPNWAKL